MSDEIPMDDHAGEDAFEAFDEDTIDFAVAAYREEGAWVVAALPAAAAASLDSLEAALRRLPGEGGVIGLVAVADEFFILARTSPQGLRLVLSDGGAVLDWPILQDACDALGVEWEIDELDDFEPVGDLSIAADLGLPAEELTLICEDEDMYPEDQARAIAKRMGCGREFADALRRA